MHIHCREAFTAGWSTLEKRLLPSYVWTSDPLTFWRERTLFLICFIGSVFGPIALVPSLLLAYREGLWIVILVDSLAYMAAVTILIARNASFVARALVFCFILYALGVCILFILGPFGAGYIWLFGASVLISTLIGVSAAIWTLVFNAIVMLSVGIFIAYGYPWWILHMDNALEKWLVISTNFLLLNAGVTITTAFILNRMKIALFMEQKTSQRLLKSEELFRSSMENAPDGIYMSDMNGTFLYGNRKSEEIIGHKREKLIGKNFLELNLLTEKGLNKAVQWLQQSVKGNPTGPDEIELINKEGRIIPVEIHTSVVQCMGQGIILGFVRDITDRKCIEEKLQNDQQELNAITDASPIAISWSDMQGNIKYTNRKFQEIFGYTVEDIPNINDWLLLAYPSPTYREYVFSLVSSHIEAQAQGKEANPIEVTVVCKNGSIRHVLQTMLFTSNRILVIYYDITERKKAEEALKESEQRYLELSIIDDLTQLYNSRHFYAQLEREMERSNRYEQPVTLLMLDLDKFKEFNDKYGHVEGDYVLLRLGQVIKRCLRETDSAYRYGGEEFTIMLPMTTSEEGIVTAKRIQTELRKETFSPVLGEEVYVTVSIGLAQHKPEEEMKTFVHRADQLMYQAKKKGRDRIFPES